MASAESQGKTIALIVFAVLFVVATCAWYIYFDKVDQLQQQLAGATSERAKAQGAETLLKTQYEELRGKTAGKEGDTHETVVGLVKQDMESAKDKLNEQRRANKPEYETYTSALAYLHGELSASDDRVKTLEQQNTNLENEVKALKSKYDQEVAKAQQAQSDKEQELARESEALKRANDDLGTQLADVTAKYGRLRDQNEQLRRDLEKNTKDHNKAQADKQRIIEQLREKDALTDQIKFSQADGEIVMVDQNGKQAFVNIGQEEGAMHGLTFGIYGKDVGGNPYQLPKANIEIVRILGPHRALGRVTGEKNDNPVLPGDLLFNPVWDAGGGESIAFVGLMLLDEDNKDDSEQFRQLVESLGAKVDAFADIKNERIVGKLSVDTGWLVVGEIPEDLENKDAADPEMQRITTFLRGAKRDLFNQARENGVRLINLRNFLTYMGHNKPDNRVAAGAEYRHYFGKKRPPLVDKGPQAYDAEK